MFFIILQTAAGKNMKRNPHSRILYWKSKTYADWKKRLRLFEASLAAMVIACEYSFSNLCGFPV